MQIQLSIFNKTFSVKVVYLLLTILLAGAFIRFYQLDYTGLWLDEIYSMQGSNPNTTLADVYKYSVNDQPPAFFFLLHAWLKLFGYTDLAGRLLAAIIGVLGIGAMYFLGREFKDESVGLLVAFITAINWFHVRMSMDVRFYGLVFLLSTLSYFFFLRAIKKTQIVDFICYAIFTGLLLNTHYFGMVLFCTQLLIFAVIVFFFKKDVRLFVGGMLAGVAAALTFFHWKPMLDAHIQITSFHVTPMSVRFLYKFVWWYVYDPAAFFIYVAGFGLAVKHYYSKFVERTFSAEDFVVAGWLIIGFMIPFVYSVFRMPLFTNKYCTIQLPAIFLLVSIGITNLRGRAVRLSSVLILFISACIVLFIARPPYKKSWHQDGKELAIMYFTMDEANEKTWDEDWREVAEFFAADSLRDEVVFSHLSWFHEYYFKQHRLRIPLDPNTANVQEAIQGKDQIWLLFHNDYKDKNQKTQSFLPSDKELIRRDFELDDIVYFKRSKAFLYRRKTNQEGLTTPTTNP